MKPPCNPMKTAVLLKEACEPKPRILMLCTSSRHRVLRSTHTFSDALVVPAGLGFGIQVWGEGLQSRCFGTKHCQCFRGELFGRAVKKPFTVRSERFTMHIIFHALVDSNSSVLDADEVEVD